MSSDRVEMALRCAQSVVQMHFTVVGYGTTADATALATKIIDHLNNEGRIK